MKKILSIISGFAIFFNGYLLVFASFTDVPTTHPYVNDINYLQSSGIVSGMHFKPRERIKRAAFAQWTLKNSGFSAADYTPRTQSRFSDVPLNNSYAPYIYKLVDLGVINIPNSGEFKPNASISKTEALAWIFSVEGIPVPKIIDESQFQATDVAPGSAIAPLIDKAMHLGVLSAGKARPTQKITRAEAAHYLKAAKSGSGTLTVTIMPSVDSDMITNPKFDVMAEVWNRIVQTYLRRNSLDKEKLIYGAIEGMAREVGDKHTDFERPGISNVLDSLSNEVEGIGAVLQMKDDEVVIVAPIVNSPAEKAGLLGGDVITAVDDTPVKGMRLDDVATRIRGQKGTQVKLTIQRGVNILNFSITRDIVQIVSASARRTSDNIAIITLSNFGENSTAEFRNAISDFQTNRPSGIVLDLRNNPGGFLNTSVEIAGYFIRSGQKITTVKYPDHEEPQLSNGNAQLAGYKIVVLVNSGSASASEILAGALQDFGLAKIIGEKTYGKGTVQEVTSFTDGSVLKLTIAEWLTPNGRSIEGNGVVPDTVVQRTSEDVRANRDPQMDQALVEVRR